MELSLIQIVCLIVIPFVAYIIKGATGFGPALIIMPIFSVVFSPFTSLVYSAILDFLAGLYMFRSIKVDQDEKTISLKLFLYMIFGALAGIALLNHINVTVLTWGIIVFSVLFAFYYFLFNQHMPRLLNIPYSFGGLIGGFVGTVTGMSGPPIVLSLVKLKDKKKIRSILVSVFLAMSALKILLYMLNNFLSWDVLLFSAIGIIPGILGLFLGDRIHNFLPQNSFMNIVMILILFSAVLSALSLLS